VTCSHPPKFIKTLGNTGLQPDREGPRTRGPGHSLSLKGFHRGYSASRTAAIRKHPTSLFWSPSPEASISRHTPLATSETLAYEALPPRES
jgi:hypothetical protein